MCRLARTMEDADKVLVISFTGYKSEEVTVRNETTINITLTASENSLEQVVVIGYGTQRKSDLTGSVSQVRSGDLNAFPVISPVQGLQGKAAGVQITQNSGEPGNALSVRIRGGNSLRGNNEPLYVIDGFAIGDNPNALNPADIETVEILKDATATAIYGSRGANGVVIITTKKGKAGKSQVDFDSYYGVQQVIKKLTLLNASEFAGLANERAANDRVSPYFTQDEINAFRKGTDWQEELFRVAPIQSHSVTFSGGTDRTQYAVSGSYFRQQGIVLGSDYWRGSVRANINHKISNKFTLSYNNILSHIERSLINSDNGQRGNSIVSAILAAPPTIAPYDANGNYSVVNGYSFSPNALQNPLAMALELKNKLKENYILTNLSITYEPVKNLSLKVSAGIENNPTQRDFYSPRILAASPTGTASINHAQQYNILNENILNYTRSINKIHSITVTGGVTYQHQTNSVSSSGASGFSTDVLQTNSLSSGTSPGIPNSSLTEWTLLSYLGRINYAYRNKYLITISDRADGSSRFGQNNKWGYFPSAAFAWKVLEEEFIKNSNVLSDLKFRASWGKTGSTALAPYQTLNTLNDVQTSFNNQLYIGFAPGAVLASSDLKWETTAQSNLGIDIAFLKNRLQLTVDVYDKNTSDLLAVVPLAPSYGYTSTVQNIVRSATKESKQE